MPVFIDTAHGSINADRIVSLSGTTKEQLAQGHRTAIDYIDGEGDDCRTYSWLSKEAIKRATSPVIPAEPGYRIVIIWHPDKPDDPLEIHLSDPIIGWAVGTQWPEPITADGPVGNVSGVWGILTPVGTVIQQAETTFGSVEEFLSCAEADRKREREDRQAQAEANG